MGEQFGVAGEQMAGGVERFLVQRGGADRLYPTRQRKRGRAFDVTVGGLAGNGGHDAPREIGWDVGEVDDIEPNRRRFAGGRVVDAAGDLIDSVDVVDSVDVIDSGDVVDSVDVGVQPAQTCGQHEPGGIADHDRAAHRGDVGAGKCLDDHLRTDAGGVTHRDRDERAGWRGHGAIMAWRGTRPHAVT